MYKSESKFRLAALASLCLAASLLSVNSFADKFEHLAMTPPMGWNSWNHFGCNVDEKMIKATADMMVKSGMKDAGYEYVNIDDCWHGERDANGRIQPDPKHFPSGMKALADYVHKKGLKLGIYSDAGWTTCAGKPGSRGYEFIDAKTYAEWGIDYVKYDWCATDGLKAEGAYMTMSKAVKEAGRPMILSICEWGDNKPWNWAAPLGQLWRTTGDIYACFDCEYDHGTWSSWGVLQILDMQDGLRKFAGPGHWNDPDMMEVGNGMTLAEDRAHFSMWAMLAAPLIAGNDLRNMSKETTALLTNKAVIAVDQDALGIQGFKYEAEDGVEVWFKPLVNDEWAMAVLNRNNHDTKFEFRWRHKAVKDELTKRSIDFNADEYSWQDLWDKDNSGSTKDFLKIKMERHSVFMVRLTPKAKDAK
ncbi:glycoside hydrolase family 27 protein [Teredinibacter waterburyi]|uniref:glycoside hydrolase family 27 protein n=1 Tax=Teredinibacter waterburyi TaxID=1500538 RepID=UPI00165FED68|nr:glycoside hydrolase family 27 protein [Teredinibacter waterburyi]